MLRERQLQGGQGRRRRGGGEVSAGRTPSPDGSTWSPTATSSPSVAAAGEDEGDAEQSAGGEEDGDDEESAAGRTPSPDGSTWSPTVTPPPMVIPDETIVPTAPETMLPTESPILADDYRNFFFCGTNWTDASIRCHKWCKSGLHTECDAGEECFAQADCEGGVEIKPETLAPTVSPVPTVSPASTLPPTTVSPSTMSPSVGPTTSTSEGSTLPPVDDDQSAELDMDLDMSMSMSMEIPISVVPTAVPPRFDSDAPVAAPSSASPTHGNVDDQEFAPDDPAGFFFCGTDWNHAITDCPHRCPTGEGSQCPDGMFCYAFTPCVGVGGVGTDPTVKPTWEPTPHPISSSPTTKEQFWSDTNDEMHGEGAVATTPPASMWTESPTPKASYAPTEDQCRGLPCDYKGECRSDLGFCGEGILYCDSKSSWVPTCGGGDQLALLEKDEIASDNNVVPTASPLTSWEAWVNTRDENATAASDEQADGWYDGDGNETSQGNETGNVITPGASWDNWAVSEWAPRSSSTKWGCIFPFTTVLLAVFDYII